MSKFKEPEPAPPWTDFKMLTQNKQFKASVDRLYGLKKRAKELKVLMEQEQEKVKPVMELLLESKGVKSVQVEEVRVTVSKRAGKITINGKKLLDEGVDPKAIAKATEQGKDTYALNVTGPKEEPEDE